MSFVDSAAEALDRTEASLTSLMSEAIKAKSYQEVASIAAMAASVAKIGRGRTDDEPRRMAPSAPEIGLPASAAGKKAEPSWIRPTT